MLFKEENEEIYARAIAASLFILMLEKKYATTVLEPYLDTENYPEKATIKPYLEYLEREAYQNRKNPVAVSSIMTQTASFCYRCFLRDYRTGLALTERAEALLAAKANNYPDDSIGLAHHLPFLLARSENHLHLSLFQWRAGQMLEAKQRLEDSVNTLTIAYERYLARKRFRSWAGSIEMLLTQTLGTLAERLWIDGDLGWAKARIYRALQTIPRAAAPDVPGRSIDTCRRGYAFILAARIESAETLTNYRHAIALTKNAEWCFEDLAKHLHETATPHAWLIRAQLQRLQCYIKAGKLDVACAQLPQVADKVEKITDREEQDFSRGMLALTRTWLLEHEAEAADYEQATLAEREKKWNACLEEAKRIISSERIPGRLRREGWLHEGRAWLKLALCLRHKRQHTKDEKQKKRLEQQRQQYETQGQKLVRQAIQNAGERHRSNIEAAGHLTLFEGLAFSDPSAAITSLRAFERLRGKVKSTHLERQFNTILARTFLPERDDVVKFSMQEEYKTLKNALKAAYFDYHTHLGQGKTKAFINQTGWTERTHDRTNNQVNKQRGIVRGPIRGNHSPTVDKDVKVSQEE